MRPRHARTVVAGGLLLTFLAASSFDPAAATPEAITGTATTTGGSTSTNDYNYSSPGVLGTGTLHVDYTFMFVGPGATTTGSGVLTRADGATLSATETSTVGDFSSTPFPVVIHLVPTSGTGDLAGFTGEIVLTGMSTGPGAVGDVYTMTGTLDSAPPAPSSTTTPAAKLARTGSSSTLLYTGTGLVVAGGCLVAISRRQRFSHSGRR